MPPPHYRYKLLLAITVDSDLKGHISPIELRDALRAEADEIDQLDDYIVLGDEQNRQYLTVCEEIAVEAEKKPVGGQDDFPGVA